MGSEDQTSTAGNEDDSDADHCYSTDWETSSNEEDEDEREEVGVICVGVVCSNTAGNDAFLVFAPLEGQRVYQAKQDVLYCSGDLDNRENVSNVFTIGLMDFS